MQHKAQRAVKTYVRSVHKNKDKEIFDVTKLPIDQFSASVGLPLTPKLRFLNQKIKREKMSGKSSILESEDSSDEDELEIPGEELDIGDFKAKKVDKGVHLGDNTRNEDGSANKIADIT